VPAYLDAIKRNRKIRCPVIHGSGLLLPASPCPVKIYCSSSRS
jgi:hypothetical protein